MKSKEQKREEAVERQAEHDGLNTMQKLGKLGKLAGRPGESKRERERLLAAL